MKKLLIIFLLFIISIYSIYYDLNIGTLPQTIAADKQETELNSNRIINELNYEEIVVEPGYTVLTIVEELHAGPVKASIQQVIIDFEQLNPGTNASNIQMGESYLFPIYQ